MALLTIFSFWVIPQLSFWWRVCVLATAFIGIAAIIVDAYVRSGLDKKDRTERSEFGRMLGMIFENNYPNSLLKNSFC
jgi:hypothetical protein